jgi:fibro-slime domain-containing protein
MQAVQRNKDGVTMFLRGLVPATALAAMVLSAFPLQAEITMSATYFTIAEGDQDMNHLAGGVINNEVLSAIGADGLPVLNTASPSPQPQDLTASGEITWWSPSLNSNVTQTGTGNITLPYANQNFFPPNGGGTNGDGSGFQAAVFATTLDVPTVAENISFSVGADDVAFVYLDGTLVCDLGGVHGDSPGTCTTGDTIGVGDHSLELFYADIENTQAALTFDVTTTDVTGSPTPEPGTMVLFGSGLAGLILVRSKLVRRKRA